jgi:hypothetical protein
MFPAAWLLLLSFIMIPSNVCGMLNCLSYRELRRFCHRNNHKIVPFCIHKYTGCVPLHSLQLYNNFLQNTGPSLNSTSTVPPSLLHISGYGRQFDNLIQNQSLQREYDQNKPAPEEQPTFLLKSSTNFLESQCLTMSTDLFDPTYCAVLQSELQLGENAFEVVLDTGCSFAMTHELQDFVSAPVFDD